MGIKVASALSAAHRERCKAVLQCLFKAQELEYRKVYFGTKADASLVRADRAVELNAVAAVDVGLAFVVCPRNAEHDDSFRLYETLENRLALKLLLHFCNDRIKSCQNFLNRLEEFGFVGILSLNVRPNSFNVFVFHCFSCFAAEFEAAGNFNIIKFLSLVKVVYGEFWRKNSKKKDPPIGAGARFSQKRLSS